MRKLAWLVAIVALGAQAEIYKWTDEKGQVHYGEQPPPDANTKTIKAPAAGPESAPGDTPGKAPPADGKNQLKAGLAADKDGPNKTPSEKDDRCKYEKQQLDTLNKGEVRYYDDKKQLQTLSGDKRDAAKAQVQENIKRYCS
ncbi:MAG TPA: DUF4124 domain-containing protein [Usitatibacter sp.]|nr:DUF4124 domain-containing protein [Usitatibacter sp.]